MSTTGDVIDVSMSRMDGCRAAAVMVADGRLTPELLDDCRSDGRAWGDSDFSIGDGACLAFLGSGCEEFSRHHQFMGENWQQDHIVAFWHGFVTVARDCLWPGGFKQ